MENCRRRAGGARLNGGATPRQARRASHGRRVGRGAFARRGDGINEDLRRVKPAEGGQGREVVLRGETTSGGKESRRRNVEPDADASVVHVWKRAGDALSRCGKRLSLELGRSSRILGFVAPAHRYGLGAQKTAALATPSSLGPNVRFVECAERGQRSTRLYGLL